MKKTKKILIAFILVYSILMLLSPSAYANQSSSMNNISTEKVFDIIPKGNFEYTLDVNTASGVGSISFEKRAKNFKLIFKNQSSGRVIFSKTFFMAGPADENGNPQGVESLKFEMDMNSISSYSIEVKNLDTVMVRATLFIKE